MATPRRRKSRGIAETYIHIKDVPLNLSTEKALRYLKSNAHLWAEETFNKSVVVEIQVEEGSLKAWVFVGGVALFGFVSNYGSFRSGIDHMVSDAKVFSEIVIERFETDQHIPEAAIARTEKRLGVPGKIQRFYRSLDKLNSDDMSNNDRHIEIDRLQDEFVEILELLDYEEDKRQFSEDVTGKNGSPKNHFITDLSNDEKPKPFPLPQRDSPLIAPNRKEDEDDA